MNTSNDPDHFSRQATAPGWPRPRLPHVAGDSGGAAAVFGVAHEPQRQVLDPVAVDLGGCVLPAGLDAPRGRSRARPAVLSLQDRVADAEGAPHVHGNRRSAEQASQAAQSHARTDWCATVPRQGGAPVPGEYEAGAHTAREEQW
ncbi:hypothetical protein GCM10027168_69450 [Streptomyces capparidis]